MTARIVRSPAERILARIDTSDPDVCWIWPGAKTGMGYGSIMTGSRTDGTRRVRDTHLVLWEHFNGPVPAGLELDHLCRTPLCCNPKCLDPVPHKVNMQRIPESMKREIAARLTAARAQKALATL